ncbi:MAG: hypothetical protein H6710_22150 [Myxococcales bacterium]|nr:hypothetical protein [Myxococcales bacterium]
MAPLSPAHAGEAPASSTDAASPPPAPAKAKKSAKSRGSAGDQKAGGKKVISLDDDFLVEGKLDKPSAFYILRRSASDYDWARLSVELAPLVLESVQDPLF